MSHFCQLVVNLPYFLNPDIKSQYGAQYILLKGKKLNIFSPLDLRYIFKFKFWKKEKDTLPTIQVFYIIWKLMKLVFV